MDLRLLFGGALVIAGAAAPLVFDIAPTEARAEEGSTEAAALPVEAVAAENASVVQVADAVPLDRTRGQDDLSVPLRVERRLDEDGVEYVTLVGSNVSLFTVARRVAELSNRLLFGFEERALAAPLVTVDLRDRPLEEALEYVLGSAGLAAEITPSVLDVRTADLFGDADALRMRALAGYSRSTLRHVDSALAPRARLAQGALEEERGNDTSAIGHYQLLIEAHPASPLVLEATLRIADALARQGEWNLALGQYTHVTAISPQALTDAGQLPRSLEEYRVRATLQIARCNVELGRAEFAVLILRVHEREHPDLERDMLVQRVLLMARARLAGGSYIEALNELDELERGPVALNVAVEALELRARCFEGLDLRKEAARAWLTHARQVRDPERAASYERAAELFLALEDHLGVLFVAGEAGNADTSADLGTQERLARAALGLPVHLDATNSSAQERYEAAQRAAAREDWEGVAQLIAPLFRELELVPFELRDDVVIAHAQHAFATKGLDAALDVLRDARITISRVAPDSIARIDGYAGQLLEQSRQFERAMEAYDGRY
jgi:hypothetical protein